MCSDLRHQVQRFCQENAAACSCARAGTACEPVLPFRPPWQGAAAWQAGGQASTVGGSKARAWQRAAPGTLHRWTLALVCFLSWLLASGRLVQARACAASAAAPLLKGILCISKRMRAKWSWYCAIARGAGAPAIRSCARKLRGLLPQDGSSRVSACVFPRWPWRVLSISFGYVLDVKT